MCNINTLTYILFSAIGIKRLQKCMNRCDAIAMQTTSNDHVKYTIQKNQTNEIKMQISVCVLWMCLCKCCFSLLIFLCGNRQEQLRKRHWKKRCQIKSKGNCILLRHIESHLKTLTFSKEHSQVVQFNMLCTFGARSTQLRISCSIVILSIFVLVFLLLLALSVNSVIEPNWFRLAIFDL